MDFLLHTLLSYLLLYKYTALFLVTLLAAIALPIPSAATLMAASAFASQGYLNISWVLFTASLGNILGDSIGYWLARKFGKPIFYLAGLRKVIDSPQLQVVERFVKKRPGLVIFISRFEVLATLSVNCISGLGKLSYKKFLAYEITGEITQVCMYAAIGYIFGSNWESVNSVIGQFSLLISLSLLILAVTF